MTSTVVDADEKKRLTMEFYTFSFHSRIAGGSWTGENVDVGVTRGAANGPTRRERGCGSVRERVEGKPSTGVRGERGDF